MDLPIIPQNPQNGWVCMFATCFFEWNLILTFKLSIILRSCRDLVEVTPVSALHMDGAQAFGQFDHPKFHKKWFEARMTRLFLILHVFSVQNVRSLMRQSPLYQ